MNDTRSQQLRNEVSQSSGVVTRSSSKSTNSGKPQMKRCRRMTDAALDPLKGAYVMRLDKSIPHNPIDVCDEAKGKRQKCQLHWWARSWDGKEIKGKNVMKCSVCNVFLCTDCWSIFHEKANVVAERQNIARIKRK